MNYLGSDYPNKFKNRTDQIKTDLPNLIRLADLTQPFDPAAVFGEDRPWALEIGAGKGHFLEAMGPQNPGMSFLGLEYKLKRCHLMGKRFKKLGLTNVKVIWAEATMFLKDYVAPGSLSAIYVNFPDPWPKRRHVRRRLLQEDFIALLVERLAPAGEMTIATDFVEYADEIADRLQRHPDLVPALEPPFIRPHLEGYPQTQFEKIFREQGLTLHFMRVRKKS